MQSYQAEHRPHLQGVQGPVGHPGVLFLHTRYHGGRNVAEVCSSLLRWSATQVYERCLGYRAGKPADYIPQLARGDPAKWGVSLCTIDGQRFSVGDVKDQFSIQSTRSAGAHCI